MLYAALAVLDVMSSFDSSVHRLAGSTGQEVGGLIIKKKPAPSQEAGQAGDGEASAGKGGSSRWDRRSAEFKKPAPRASIFGLDALAKRKREEKEAREEASFGEKRLKTLQSSSVSEKWGGFSDSEVRISFGKSSESLRERTYRQPRTDTPSHPGGVSEEALERIQRRLRREQPVAVGGRSREGDTGSRFR